jgi:hypothetical protein
MMPEYWEVLDGLSNIGSKQTVKDRDITMTSPLREFLYSPTLEQERME